MPLERLWTALITPPEEALVLVELRLVEQQYQAVLGNIWVTHESSGGITKL